MPAPIVLINGPNLNMLGKREPEIYGKDTLKDIEIRASAHAKTLGLKLTCFQSNHEGEIVERIQQALGKEKGLIINPGAYTHTSIAIRDALSMLACPIIEVHLSNIHAREAFRHHSHVSGVAKGVICGFGAEGYMFALSAMKDLLKA